MHIFLVLQKIKAENAVPRSAQRVSRYPGLCQLESEASWGNLEWVWPLFLYSWADDVINSAGGFQLSPSDQGEPGGRHENGGGDSKIRRFKDQAI